jgi:hypothetical protein
MELNSLEILVLGIWVGWQFSNMYRSYNDKQLFKIVIKKINEEEEELQQFKQDLKKSLPVCYVEKADKKDYLLYNKETDEFICQGTSYEELAELCKDRYDTVLVRSDDKSMWFMDGEVKELTSE